MHIKEFKKNLSTIILCGGKGKRLLPLTKLTPKPLIKIKNEEILSYIVKHLLNYEINEIFLSTGLFKNNFKKFIKKKKI